jgi:hypothetical protein
MFNRLDHYELDGESSSLGLRHFFSASDSRPSAANLTSRIERGGEHG